MNKILVQTLTVSPSCPVLLSNINCYKEIARITMQINCFKHKTRCRDVTKDALCRENQN